jgi:hypothetical protein
LKILAAFPLFFKVEKILATFVGKKLNFDGLKLNLGEQNCKKVGFIVGKLGFCCVPSTFWSI